MEMKHAWKTWFMVMVMGIGWVQSYQFTLYHHLTQGVKGGGEKDGFRPFLGHDDGLDGGSSGAMHEGFLSAERWGYSFLAVLVISGISFGLATLLLVVPLSSRWMRYIMASMLSLGTGVLLGDALLHLIPAYMEMAHDHDEHDEPGHEHDHETLWRMCVALLGLFGFYLVEKILHTYTGHSHSTHATHVHLVHNDHSCGHHDAGKDDDRERLKKEQAKEDHDNVFMMNENGSALDCTHIHSKVCFEAKDKSDLDGMTIESLHNLNKGHDKKENHSHTPISPAKPFESTNPAEYGSQQDSEKGELDLPDHHHSSHHDQKKPVKPMGWLIIFGDSLHNFIDGLVIAAAFSSNRPILGVSTSLAILLHEVPHELADFAILIAAGMSRRSIILYNLLSTAIAFIGIIVGLTVGTNATFQAYVFAITAATFLYIALANVIPEMVHSNNRIQFIIVESFFILLGFTTMLIIALYAENMLQ